MAAQLSCSRLPALNSVDSRAVGLAESDTTLRQHVGAMRGFARLRVRDRLSQIRGATDADVRVGNERAREAHERAGRA